MPSPEIAAALGRLEPITLDEMDSITLLNRIDSKFASGTSYKYGIVSGVPSGSTALFDKYYCEGGTASVSGSL